VIGDESQREKVLHVLQENRVHLQKRMSKRVVLKYTPQLNFKLDDSVARGVNLISLMDELEAAGEEESAEGGAEPRSE
jgi:ribosome-binding factor A